MFIKTLLYKQHNEGVSDCSAYRGITRLVMDLELAFQIGLLFP
jgi:hypothetical protein